MKMVNFKTLIKLLAIVREMRLSIYAHSASITCERDASRLEENKREQRAKTSKHIAKARGYISETMESMCFTCRSIQGRAQARRWRIADA